MVTIMFLIIQHSLLKPRNDYLLIQIKSPYFTKDVISDPCKFTTALAPIIFDRNQVKPHNNFYWVESELTDPINDCVNYCKKNIRVHFNNNSAITTHGNVDYHGILNHPDLIAVRRVNQKYNVLKQSTVLVLLSSCNWRVKLINKMKQKDFDWVLKGACFRSSPTRRSDLMSIGDLISISNFKYYFAVENSNCYGYVSEKIHKALITGVIPMVYNLSNYPPEYDEIKPYLLDLSEPIIKRVELPSETILQNYYRSWKTDYQQICDFYSRGRDKTYVNDYDSYYSSCLNRFHCIDNDKIDW